MKGSVGRKSLECGWAAASLNTIEILSSTSGVALRAGCNVDGAPGSDADAPLPRQVKRANSADSFGCSISRSSARSSGREVFTGASNEFLNHINNFIPNKSLNRMKLKTGFYTKTFQSWKRLHTSRAQLKAVSNISALLAGFAMVAMVEINLQPELPDALYIAFASCTTILVVMHTLALMISTCILPHVDTIAGLKRIDLVDDSPHEMLRSYIQFAWILSTVSGIVLFMVEVVLLCWMQFYLYSTSAAYASTAIVLPSLVIFGYIAWKFYGNLNRHLEVNSQKDIHSLEDIAAQLKETPLGSLRVQNNKERTHSIIEIPDFELY